MENRRRRYGFVKADAEPSCRGARPARGGDVERDAVSAG